VQKETAQELRGAKSHLTLLATTGVIFPAESHALLFEHQQAMIFQIAVSKQDLNGSQVGTGFQ
jgi:hypothetical protein